MMKDTCNALHFETSNNTCSLAEVGTKLYNTLALELRATQVTTSYSLCLPALELFYQETTT